MNKKNVFLTVAAVVIIVLIVAIPVFKSKYEYKKLTRGTEHSEETPVKVTEVPSYKDKLYESVVNPTAVPDEPTITDVPNDIGQGSVEVKENPTASYEPVEFATVVKGKGIKAKSDEEIANAGGYHVGDTVLDNAQYVLYHDSKYYALIYTEKKWDGFLIQDVTVGDAFDTIEEAFNNAGVSPKGVPMYLPLNIGGIQSVAEFNKMAKDIVLVVYDGTEYSRISYADLVQ